MLAWDSGTEAGVTIFFPVTLNSIQSRIVGRIVRGGMVFNCPSAGDSGSDAGVTMMLDS